MSGDQQRVLRVRTLLAAHGGWNARSRAAIVAWARAEGLDEATLARVLREAVGVGALPREPTSSAPVPMSAPVASRRVWPVAAAVLGLLCSIWLLSQLSQRVASTPRKAPAPAVSSVVAPSDSTRSLPPPPVSFPTAPDLGAGLPDTPMQPPEPLAVRPSRALERAELRAWEACYASLARHWAAMPRARRDAVLRSLAEWMAASADAAELQSMQATVRRMSADEADGRIALLSEALERLLRAKVAASDRLSPAVAAAEAFSSGPGTDDDEPLEAWARDRVTTLAAGIGDPQARARWAGWLEAVAALERPVVRATLALGAIDALLRTEARIDTQGVAADAIGSLARALAASPSQAGFEVVRERFVAWLVDPRVPSDRLWAFGGIWRSVGTAPDATLLVGARDSMTDRARLADAWRALGEAGARPVWQPMLRQVEQARTGLEAPIAARIEALADAVHRLRMIDAALDRRDPDRVARATAPEWPDTPPSGEPEERWASALRSPRPEIRQQALQSIRTAAPSELAREDAAALATRAFASGSREERELAQQVIRESCLESTVMRRAIAQEVVLAADPRPALGLLQDLGGFALASDDAAALRADALGAILAGLPPGASLRAPQTAAQRLAAECAEWLQAPGPRSGDAAHAAWGEAERRARDASTLRPLPPLDAFTAGAEARVRRLRRLAPDGPRGFAAALAVIADLEGVRAAVQRPADLSAISSFMHAQAVARARAADAIEQAEISLAMLARLRLVALGAPPPSPSSAAPGGTGKPGAGWNAFMQAEALASEAQADDARLRARLRESIDADPALSGPAALLLARVEQDPSRRRAWLERADALGAGVPIDETDMQTDAMHLATLLAAAERLQADRFSPPKQGGAVRAAWERFAALRALALDELLAALRTPSDPARAALLDALRECVVRRLRPDARAWLGALADGVVQPVPEADAARPALLLEQLD